MLTLRTKLALAVLHDIQYKDYQLSTSLNPSPSEITYLLQRLSKEHLITLIENQPDNQSVTAPNPTALPVHIIKSTSFPFLKHWEKAFTSIAPVTKNSIPAMGRQPANWALSIR
ncbi:hypothetical protein [Bacteroides cellulosilyticus]|uniref:hypothetical protein n=1 Tax=Bacteroides cellulosilyticus TaxID=246787 RepID=UPI001E38EBEC|nr:hypothetical protein [Bacteroides cellulosilyticus]